MDGELNVLRQAADTLDIELNAVTDNPLIFAEDDTALSGGNFHAQPVAFAADIIAMALCEVGSISERRTSVLVAPNMRHLPAFLTDDGGPTSGTVIPQRTPPARAPEHKSLATPPSRHPVPPPPTPAAGFSTPA